MLISLERSIDGVVGRMLSWLSHPPVRPLADRESLSDRTVELVDKAPVAVADGIESAINVADELVIETVVKPVIKSSSDRPKRQKSRNKIDSKKTTRRKATRSKRSVAGRQKARAKSEAVGVIEQAVPSKTKQVRADSSSPKAAKTMTKPVKPAPKTARPAPKTAKVVSKATESAPKTPKTPKSAAAKIVETAAESVKSPPRTDDLEASITAALAGVDDGLAMKELVAGTGAERNAIRRNLKRLIDGNRVQRKGEGMRTRYYWTKGE